MSHSPAFLAIVAEAKQRIQECSVAQVRQKDVSAQPFVLIDVREDHEWAAGHLPEAIHLGKGILERDIEQQFPDKTQPMVLYCGGGFRSALAADTLQRMGYQAVYSMAGGYRAWCEANLPIIKP